MGKLTSKGFSVKYLVPRTGSIFIRWPVSMDKGTRASLKVKGYSFQVHTSALKTWSLCDPTEDRTGCSEAPSPPEKL